MHLFDSSIPLAMTHKVSKITGRMSYASLRAPAPEMRFVVLELRTYVS